MIEVYPNLFVGSGADLIYTDDGNSGVKDGWYVISAAKDPWHREALAYKTQAAPKDSPEYLLLVRGNRLILNLIDPPDPAYIPDAIVRASIDAISNALKAGEKALVHCNQGNSRAPTLALLWMRRCSPMSHFLSRMDWDTAKAAFTELYPPYAPGKGMEEYARNHWIETTHE